MPEYSYKTVPTQVRDKTYRCKVFGDSAATLTVGRKLMKVHVREKSGNGFTLGITPKQAKKINAGSQYTLQYDDRRMDVIAESYAETVQGEARLQVGTIREFEPKESWAFRFPFMKGTRILSYDCGIDSAAAYGGFVLVLFCVMSLPGIGEQLGTASRIEWALTLVGNNIAAVVYAIAG